MTGIYCTKFKEAFKVELVYVEAPLLNERKLMNISDRNGEISLFFDDCFKIIEKKGKDYNPDGIAFSEIKTEAKTMGLRPEQYMLVLMSKHYGAVKTYCATGNLASEPIKERLKDLANYAAMLSVMIEEGKNKFEASELQQSLQRDVRLGHKVTVYDRMFLKPVHGYIIGLSHRENNEVNGYTVKFNDDEGKIVTDKSGMFFYTEQCRLIK